MKKLFLLSATAISYLLSHCQPIWQPNGTTIVYTDRQVGIGTSTPESPLHVKDAIKIRGASAATLFLTNDNPSAFSRAEVHFANTNSVDPVPFCLLSQIEGTGNSSFAMRERFSSGGFLDYILFDKASREILINYSNTSSYSFGNILFANGNVGIGTLTPSAKLDVTGNIHTTDKIIASAFASNSPLILEAPVTVERARIDDLTGNFGIGTNAPHNLVRLHIFDVSNTLTNGHPATLRIEQHFVTTNTNSHWDLQVDQGNLYFNNSSVSPTTASVKINSQGDVGIGTTTLATGYKLSVKGKIISEEVTVKLFSSWPDFAFKPNYKFMSLKERKKYNFENFHMPYMKSAKENGDNIGLGETLTGLTQNVEDHDHYLFQHDERIEQLEKKNAELEKKNKELENRLEKLEKKNK